VAVASAGPYANHLHLAPDQTTMPVPHHLVFIGRMPFLLPHQQHQSTEGKSIEGKQWHQLDNMQIICTSLQTDNYTSTSSLNFYLQFGRSS